MQLTKKSETASKITFTYDKPAGDVEGYLYFANDVQVSRTFNPNDLEVTFGKVASGKYAVEAITFTTLARDDWPDATPPTGKPTNTALPTISGTAQVGSTLTCNPGTWTGSPTFTYQWYYENADGSGDVAINVGGVGTTQTYTPVDADTGGKNYCVVTATNAGGSTTAQTASTAVITGGTPPPPPPPPSGTFPPSYADFSDDFAPAPDSRWTWVFGSNGNAGFPNQGAALVDDGSGGKAVRLTSPIVGGNGQLSAFYDQSGAWGKQGQRQLGQVELRLVNHSAFIWVWEWHENAGQGINSCAVGVNSNKTLRIQVSGGPTSGHQYTQLDDTQTLVQNRWYLLEWDITWSTGSTGRFNVKLDGRQVIDVARPTLLFKDGSSVPDNVVIGGYSYTPPGSNGAQVVDLKNVAVGV